MRERERERGIAKRLLVWKKNNIDSQGSALPWKHSSSIQRVVKGSETHICTHSPHTQTRRSIFNLYAYRNEQNSNARQSMNELNALHLAFHS